MLEMTKDDDRAEEALRASERAHARWLNALAALRDPERPTAEEEFRRREDEERAAFRQFMSTRAFRRDHFWAKLDAFEAALIEDLREGPSADSALLLAFGGIKDDLLGFELMV